jgi:acyl CoA:acetate/3-ketoacid CoA transferase alpha subunit
MDKQPATETIAEEYASVTISIDHLVTEAHRNGHTVVKNVWSTESAPEALLAQIAYFGQTDLLTDAGIIGMIAKGNETACIFVYTVAEELTNIIVDAALWTSTIANEGLSQGTVLGAHASLITLATDLKSEAAKAGKQGAVLAFLSE